MKHLNRYPFVFVHGMFGWGGAVGIDKFAPYWGSTSGSLIKYLTENGYNCCSASVGPVSSAWDCACELYAQLTGTRVDYGVAHSKAHSHERFGRTYTKPLVSAIGETKIHLIGHSHGGQVIRLLAHLLAYGDETEKAATDESEISGLFPLPPPPQLSTPAGHPERGLGESESGVTQSCPSLGPHGL